MTENKINSLVVEITKLFDKYNCTYNNAEEAIKKLTEYIKQERDSIDLDIVMLQGTNFKYVNKHLSDNMFITPLNHFEPYC